MKVLENGTDRTTHVHVYVKGQVHPLDEYGQYIDARDGAVCCYVAVEEGHEIKIDGRFSGVTSAVAYDCMVDGVCRKANAYAGKAVQLYKNKKLDVGSVLFKTSDGVIDTQMSVTPYIGTTNLSKEASETIGTIELRVYVTRQFDIEHAIDTSSTYDQVKDDSDPGVVLVNYKDVPPQFQMTFEENCSILDTAKANRERKKINAKRPGTQAWAIFRFHYRTKESIEANKMERSFDAADKGPGKQEAHSFQLESVPPLMLGSRPAGKNDGEISVRTSSPPPPSTPSTPTKVVKKSQSTQPKVVIQKQQSKTESPIANPSFKMAPTIYTELAVAAETPVMPKDLPDPLHATLPEDKTAIVKTSTVKNSKHGALTTRNDDGGDPVAGTPKKVTKKDIKNATEAIDAGSEMHEKDTVKNIIVKKAYGKQANEKKLSELADATFPCPPTVPHPADLSSVPDTPPPNTTLSQNVIVPNPNIKDIAKPGKSFTSHFKKTPAKPSAIDTTTSTRLQKSVVTPTPASPPKRASEGTLTPPPDVKRIRTDSVPQLTPTRLSHTSTMSLSPRSLSIEAQVTEQRKRLEDTRRKRADMAKQKAALGERLAPYKKRMADELERLRQETADEEAEMAADEEEYLAGEAMLAEFERGDSVI